MIPRLPLLVVIAASAALTACTGRDIASFFENPRGWPNERRILAKDWVVPKRNKAVEAEVHCYRTIGAVECTSTPIAGQQTRSVEDYTPIVKAPWEKKVK